MYVVGMKATHTTQTTPNKERHTMSTTTTTETATPSTAVCRFDFDQETRTAFNKAVELGITDAVGLGVLMCRWGTNAEAIMDEITGYAYSNIHTDGGQHKAWCPINDNWFANH